MEKNKLKNIKKYAYTSTTFLNIKNNNLLKNKRSKYSEKKINNKANIYNDIILLKKQIQFYNSDNRALVIQYNKVKHKNNTYYNTKLNVNLVYNKIESLNNDIITLNNEIIKRNDIIINIDTKDFQNKNNTVSDLTKKYKEKYILYLKQQSNINIADNNYIFNNNILIEIIQNIQKINERIIKINNNINNELSNKSNINKQLNLALDIKQKANNQLNVLKMKQNSLIYEEQLRVQQALESENNKLIKIINNVNHKISEKTEDIENIESKLKSNMYDIKAKNQILLEKIKSLRARNELKKKKKSTHYLITSIKNVQITQHSNQANRKLYKKVNFEDIIHIVNKLKYNIFTYLNNNSQFIADPYSKIFSYLLTDSNINNNSISINNLIEKLSIYPFFIKNYDNCLMISRFIIEDENKLVVELNKDNQSNLCIVKSIIKKLLGSLDFPPEKDFKNINNKILSLLTKEREKIIAIKNSYNLGNKMDIQGLTEILKKIDIKLNHKIINYLEYKLYLCNNKDPEFIFGNLFNILEEMELFLSKYHKKMKKGEQINSARLNSRLNVKMMSRKMLKKKTMEEHFYSPNVKANIGNNSPNSNKLHSFNMKKEIKFENEGLLSNEINTSSSDEDDHIIVNI